MASLQSIGHGGDALSRFHPRNAASWVKTIDVRILIVAATEAEIEPLVTKLGAELEVLVTGVGMTATAFALGRDLANRRCDLAINLGIAGSFDRTIDLGSVLEVSEDTLAELGAEDDEAFLSLPALGFGEATFTPTVHLKDLAGAPRLPLAKAITVNTVHGNLASIAKIESRLAPQIETMEGAAFFYACRQAGVPCLQIRAISNYVEKRNRNGWKIGPAIANLNRMAISLAETLIRS